MLWILREFEAFICLLKLIFFNKILINKRFNNTYTFVCYCMLCILIEFTFNHNFIFDSIGISNVKDMKKFDGLDTNIKLNILHIYLYMNV